MLIRQSRDFDLAAILAIYESAFGQQEEVLLTRELLHDPSAEPRLSLIAEFEGNPVGHILFTRVQIKGMGEDIKASILAPLAVLPDLQGRAVGRQLVSKGLEILARTETDLVFVLGHPGYYPRFGFKPAGDYHLEPPFPIAPENAGAWMVQQLQDGILGKVAGQVRCARTLNKPELWTE